MCPSTRRGNRRAAARKAPTAEQLARVERVSTATGKRLMARALYVIVTAFDWRVPEAMAAIQPISNRCERLSLRWRRRMGSPLKPAKCGFGTCGAHYIHQ